MKKTKLLTISALFIILAISIFFRFWQLESIPPGIYPDEAINANQAISEPGKIFYPENNGREGLFFNLINLSFSAFGISIWSFKMVSAIFGVLTVLGLYLLTKELFQNIKDKIQNVEYLALFSSFCLAVSFWHVNFSRIGFRAILFPFVLVYLFYFLFKGLRTKKALNFIIAGIFLGLGFHTYISYRFIVLLLPIILFWWFLIYRKENQTKKFALLTTYFLLFAFIVALPIGIYFLQNPEDFVSRTAGVSIFTHQNPIKAFLESLITHLGIFNIYGDGNWRHNFSGSPMLFWPIGILFLLGLFSTVKEVFKKTNYQNKDYQTLFVFCFLLSTFLVMILPAVLTHEGIPHSLRAIGVIPVTYILAGFGAGHAYIFLNQKIKNKKLLILLICLFLTITTLAQFNKYFNHWAKHPKVSGAFTKNYVEIGNYLNSLPDKIQKYVIVNEGGVMVQNLPMPAQTPMFIERTKYKEPRAIYLLPEDLNKIEIKEKTIIVPMAYDEKLFNELEQKFPGGQIQKLNGIKSYVK